MVSPLIGEIPSGAKKTKLAANLFANVLAKSNRENGSGGDVADVNSLRRSYLLRLFKQVLLAEDSFNFGKLVGLEVDFVSRLNVVLDLLGAACADKHGCDFSLS